MTGTIIEFPLSERIAPATPDDWRLFVMGEALLDNLHAPDLTGARQIARQALVNADGEASA